MPGTQIHDDEASLSTNAWPSMMRWQRRKLGAKFSQDLEAEGWEECHRRMRSVSTITDNCDQTLVSAILSLARLSLYPFYS